MFNNVRVSVTAAFAVLTIAASFVSAAEPIDIGSRRELFVDNYLVDSVRDGVQLKVHEPTPSDVVLVTGEPWEGNTSAYYTIFQDGDVYRMYYRGSNWDPEKKRATHAEVTCYAESKDGVHWTKPKLGLVEFAGSKENNIILSGPATHCFVAFKDTNPKCKADAKYKGISRKGTSGLFVFKSPDGVRWTPMSDKPVITEGYFDSQNLAFWDPHTKNYVDYHRTFVNGVRAIMMCTSDDYLTWTKPVLLKYPNVPDQHLYTNAIRPYYRAPHLRIGFPTRFLPKNQSVEPVFMSSRDGLNFHRFSDPVIPQSAPKDRAGNRSNYMANGLVRLPNNDRELAVYGTEAYYEGPDSRLRMFKYRVDGFTSLSGSEKGGDVTTKPITFDGSELEINVDARGGFVSIELLDVEGNPIEGFTLNQCQPITDDTIAQTVTWKSDKSLATLAGKPVRVRMVIRDADLYSMRFTK